jgi:hypothetical protein
MQALSYGFKLPETNDKGPVVFPAIEDNIQQLNNHNHDGANSAPLGPNAVKAVQATLLSASWVATSLGNYRQLVTMPSGLNFDEVCVNVRLPSGHYIYATIEKVSSTTFYVYTNDNSINFVVTYGG